MNQIMRWQFKELYPDKKEKLIQFLTSELIFLDECIKYTTNEKDIKLILKARKKIEKLLTVQLKNIDILSSDKEFENTVSFVFQILNKIVDKIK